MEFRLRDNAEKMLSQKMLGCTIVVPCKGTLIFIIIFTFTPAVGTTFSYSTRASLLLP